MKGFYALAMSMMVLLVLPACKGSENSQTASGKTKGDLSPELVQAYTEDAYRLALREKLSRASTGEDGAVIPAEMAQKYYAMIEKAWTLARANKEINMEEFQQIHTFGSPDLHKVMVVVDPEAAYLPNWSKGKTVTNDLYLNQIMSKYKLTVQNYHESTLGPTMNLVSPDYINTPELAFILQQVGGIKMAESMGMQGDGNNIEYGPWGKNQTALKFSIGKGDCPSGCIYRKYWVFPVNVETGAVTYFGTEGEIPAGAN